MYIHINKASYYVMPCHHQKLWSYSSLYNVFFHKKIFFFPFFLSVSLWICFFSFISLTLNVRQSKEAFMFTWRRNFPFTFHWDWQKNKALENFFKGMKIRRQKVLILLCYLPSLPYFFFVGVFILYIHFIYHVLIKAKLILMPLKHINLFRIHFFPFLLLTFFVVAIVETSLCLYISVGSLIRIINHWGEKNVWGQLSNAT